MSITRGQHAAGPEAGAHTSKSQPLPLDLLSLPVYVDVLDSAPSSAERQ